MKQGLINLIKVAVQTLSSLTGFLEHQSTVAHPLP